jgi:hypothetical protein
LEVQNAAAGTAIRASNNGGGYAELACTSNATSTAQLNFTNSLAMLGGNVGIGTSSPTDALVVEGDVASPQRIKVSNTNASGKTTLAFTQGTTVKSWLEFDNATSIFEVWQYTNNDLRFGTNNTERMRIDASGNLLVGTTSVPNAGVQKISVQQTGGDLSSTTVTRANMTGIVTKDADSPTSNYGNGIWFNSGSLMAGIASARVSTGNWGTDLRFYTHPTSTSNQHETFERMRIDSSGNLLVGTTDTDPAASSTETGVALKGGGFVSISRNDTAASVNINKVFYDGSIVDFRKNGSVVGSINNFNSNEFGLVSEKNLVLTQNTTTERNLVFSSSYFSPFAVDDGDIDLGRSVGRFKDLYLSGGVYLGGTGSANKLDDYEEGTWTPVLTGSGSNPTVTYSNQHGLYTKVGNIVTVWVYVTGSFTGGSGAVVIEGLPFNPDISMSSDIWFEPLNIGSGWQLTTYIPNNDNKIKLYKINLTGSSNDIAVQWSEVNGLEVRCSFSYKVA